MAQKLKAHSDLGSAKGKNVAFNILLALLLNIFSAKSLSKRMNRSDVVELFGGLPGWCVEDPIGP